MENSFQTSFIPKKPVMAGGAQTSVKGTTSITTVVSVFIFVVMLLSAGGLYFYYNFYLLKNKEALSANLFKIRDSFDKNTIAELEMYDKRTTASTQILGSHIVLSPLFELINELTLPSIQYTDFSHNTLNNTFSVKMSGIARDYKSIALEADVFNTDKGRMFKDVIFSNLTENKNNYVTFDLEFNVDPLLLSYTNNIADKKESATQNVILDTTIPANNNINP
ncbi:MAG: hypothetical protein WCW54_01265 [Candidatus Paceibacterota bacterium]